MFYRLGDNASHRFMAVVQTATYETRTFWGHTEAEAREAADDIFGKKIESGRYPITVYRQVDQ